MGYDRRVCCDCGSTFIPSTGNQKRCHICKDKQVYIKKSVEHEINCSFCGKKFVTKIYNRKYCSADCRNKAGYQPTPTEVYCVICGKDFIATRETQKYCGDYCREVAIRRRRLEKEGR